MSAYPSPTTGPGPGQQTLLPAPKPIIPVVPVVPVVPGQIQPSREDYNDASRSVVERTATISGVETLLPIIYGTDQTGAKITAVVASGANLLLRCEWCSAYGYGIDAVQSYFVDGVAPSGGITATHYTGTQTTPDSTLVAAYAAQGKTYTDTLAGIAYSVVSVPAGVTQGFPRIVAQIRGQKVRTTLAGSYAFNENPVWLIAWLLVDRLGVAIDWTASRPLLPSVTQRWALLPRRNTPSACRWRPSRTYGIGLTWCLATAVDSAGSTTGCMASPSATRLRQRRGMSPNR